MKILITGDAGFVGRQFHRVLDADHEIVGIDIKNGIDARDFFKSDRTAFDLVIHLAAVVGGRATIEGNPLKVATDLAIDSDMFQWALRSKPGRIVYYSSSAAYPISLQAEGLNTKLTEADIDLKDIKSPDLTYGWAKLTGEMLAEHAMAEGLKVHVFRPFSGYGSDQDLDYPFPSFIDRGLRQLNPFPIWGTGEQVRDFIHIADVVGATLEAVKQDVDGPVNLGLGQATSFNELAALVSAASGYAPTLVHDLSAPIGVMYRVSDNAKMLSFYTPRISLKQGIEMALRGETS